MLIYFCLGITLSSTIGKWWTLVLYEVMQELADEHDWMGRTQSGFTPGCQTGENVLILWTLLHRAKKKNEPLKAAFIDLKKVRGKLAVMITFLN